jgi:hypothetical protein
MLGGRLGRQASWLIPTCRFLCCYEARFVRAIDAARIPLHLVY